MHRFSAALIAAVSTIAFTQIAAGADLPRKASGYAPPPPPVYSWAGWYVGLNAGGTWGHSDVNSVFSCASAGLCFYSNPVNHAAFSAAGTRSLSDTGFIGGIQGGYNWQSGNVVAGVEADFNSFNFHASSAVGGPVPIPATAETFLVTTDVKTDWLFTARGRLGWAIAPRYLVYATGGLALTEIKVANSFANTFVPATVGASNTGTTKAGWTIGGGIEAALWGNWTVKAEYLYVDFGSVSTTLTTNLVLGATAADVMQTSANLRANIGRVGVNYRFY